MTYREPTGESKWANVDLSEVRIRQAQHFHIPGWRGAWLWCLQHRDREAADLIYDRNKVSEQCEDGECDKCHASWCTCEHHSAVAFRLEHPAIRSLSEIESERQEEKERNVA